MVMALAPETQTLGQEAVWWKDPEPSLGLAVA